MRICILGGAGRTGTHLVRLAFQRGHEVTVLLRDPAKLSQPAVRVIEGDATDLDSITRAAHGQQTLISVIAPPNRAPTHLLTDVTTALVAALSAQHHPATVVLASCRAATATHPRLAVTAAKLVRRHIYTDLTLAEHIIEASGLHATIARAARLVDQHGRGGVWTDQELTSRRGDRVLPRVDYAAALLALAENPAPPRHITICGQAR